MAAIEASRKQAQNKVTYSIVIKNRYIQQYWISSKNPHILLHTQTFIQAGAKKVAYSIVIKLTDVYDIHQYLILLRNPHILLHTQTCMQAGAEQGNLLRQL